MYIFPDLMLKLQIEYVIYVEIILRHLSGINNFGPSGSNVGSIEVVELADKQQ